MAQKLDDWLHIDLYSPVLLLTPEGHPIYAVYQSSHGGGRGVCNFVTAAGEYLEIVCDGTWSWERVKRDVFSRRTGCSLPAAKDGTVSNPWFMEVQRNPLVRAAIRLAREMGLPGEGEMRLAWEVMSGFPVYDRDLTWGRYDYYDQYEVRGFAWAARCEERGERRMEDTLLKHWADEVSMSFGYYAHGAAVHPDQLSADEISHALAVVGIPEYLLRLRAAIEAEKELVAWEIAAYMEPIPSGPPAAQMDLLVA